MILIIFNHILFNNCRLVIKKIRSKLHLYIKIYFRLINYIYFNINKLKIN